MSGIQFTKMEGAGNDYVYIDVFKTSVSDPETLARDISHRHFGVGSDGLVLIGPSGLADVRMTMYNADGSKSEMCGNAIRCVGKYAREHGLVSSDSMTIETDAGVKTLRLFADDANRIYKASVQMGVPILAASDIPSTLSGEMIVDDPFDFGKFQLRGTLVSMGNPHFVTYVEDVDQAPLDVWGPVIENHPFFPRRINVEIVEIISRTEIKQRTWERGCGETWACGTGASAVCVAGVLNNRTETTVLNHLKGGDLTLSWEGQGKEVVMEGPAREVFSGTWPLNR